MLLKYIKQHQSDTSLLWCWYAFQFFLLFVHLSASLFCSSHISHSYNTDAYVSHTYNDELLCTMYIHVHVSNVDRLVVWDEKQRKVRTRQTSLGFLSPVWMNMCFLIIIYGRYTICIASRRGLAMASMATNKCVASANDVREREARENDGEQRTSVFCTQKGN